jgi:hypothetical protein
MAQVIIYTNDAGGVSVCNPTGEILIKEVQATVTPKGSIIVDDSVLPQGEDEFFNAWELVNGKVVVNQTKKQAIIDAKQAAEDSKIATTNKLAALGLTPEDLKNILG